MLDTSIFAPVTGGYMRYLHTMVRVTDLDASIDFYCKKLGLIETNRKEFEAGRFTLVFPVSYTHLTLPTILLV